MAEVNFLVTTPSSARACGMTLPDQIPVWEAAREAARQFGYHADMRRSFQGADGVVMDERVSLADAGITDGVTVELVRVGGSV